MFLVILGYYEVLNTNMDFPIQGEHGFSALFC